MHSRNRAVKTKLKTTISSTEGSNPASYNTHKKISRITLKKKIKSVLKVTPNEYLSMANASQNSHFFPNHPQPPKSKIQNPQIQSILSWALGAPCLHASEAREVRIGHASLTGYSENGFPYHCVHENRKYEKFWREVSWIRKHLRETEDTLKSTSIKHIGVGF